MSSAAARNRRMAISPGLSLPRSCARAGVPFANKPAPIVAAPPARRPLFIKERRSTERLVLLRGFSIQVLPVLTRVTMRHLDYDVSKITVASHANSLVRELSRECSFLCEALQCPREILGMPCEIRAARRSLAPAKATFMIHPFVG